MKKSLSLIKILKYLFTEGPGVILIVAIWSLRQVITEPFILGQKFDWYLPLFDLKPLFASSFYSWNIENTGAPIGYYSAWIGDLFYGICGWLGLTPNIFIPLFLIFVLTLAGWSMLRLLRYVHKPWFFSLLAGIFYLSSPVVYIRIITGFTLWLLAYALAPLILLLFLKIIHEKQWLSRALWAGLLLGVAATQIQFFFMISLALFVVTLSRGVGFCLRERIKRLTSVIVFSLIVQLPWLLVLLFRGFKGEVETLSSGSAVLKSVTALPHSFLRTFFLNEHHITASYFDGINRQPLNFVVGLAMISALFFGILIFWRKISFRWLIITLAPIGFLITILPHPHLMWLYRYLFNTSKLVNIFREVYHAQFLSSLSYAVAIGAITAAWWRTIKKFPAKIALILGSFIFVGLFNQVSLRGNFNHFTSNFDLSEYQALWQKFEKQKSNDRVWYPLGLGFVQNKNDQVGASNGDVIARSLARPFIDEGSSVLNLPNNLTNLRNTMIHAFVQNQPIDNYLAKLRVSKIIERKDLQSLNLGAMGENNNKTVIKYWQDRDFVPVINARDWQMTALNDNVNIYRKIKSSEIIYPADSAVISSNDLTDLSQDSAVVFIAQNNGAQKIFDKLPLLDPANDLDLKASLIPNQYLINLVSYTDQNENALAGWSQGRFSWWFRPEFSSPIRPFIFTRRNDNLKIVLTNKKSGYYQALIRIWYSPRGGLISLGIGDQSIQLDTTATDFQWRWLKLDEVILSKQNKEIEINNLSGEQAIGEFILLPEQKISSIDSQVQKIKSNKKISHQDQTSVTSEFVSPTYRKVKIKNRQPFLLIFAEKYDSHWILQIGNQKLKPIIVNGWANGYWIPEPMDEAGKIIYTLQIWYLIGLVIAFLTLAAAVAISTYQARRGRI